MATVNKAKQQTTKQNVKETAMNDMLNDLAITRNRLKNLLSISPQVFVTASLIGNI